jgi:hypothetical protein
MRDDLIDSTPSVPLTRDPDAIATAAERRAQFQRHIVEAQRGQRKRLKHYVTAISERLHQTDRTARQKHLQDIDLTIRYFNADQYGEYVDGKYSSYEPQEGDVAYTIPVFVGHVEQAFMQLLRTNIEYEFHAVDAETDPAAADLAAMCESLAVEEKNRLLDEDAMGDEIMNTILAGDSYRCLVWGVDPDAPKKHTRVKYRREEVELPGRVECAKCREEQAEGAGKCLSCGSTELAEVKGGKGLRLVDDGTEEEMLGENILHIPHPVAVQRDYGATKLRHSTFIVERDYLPRHVAEWMYQTKFVEADGRAGSARGRTGHSDEVLARQEQERSGLQTDPYIGSAREGAYTYNHTVEREHIWLDVSEYGHIYLDVDEVLPDGTKLPADTILGKRFPNGVYLCIVGGQLVRWKEANRNRQWTVVQYGRRPGSGRGAGLQLLRPLQDVVNDDFNQSYAIRMTSARPLTVLNRQAVRGMPQAGQYLFIDKLPSGVSSLSGVVAQFQGQSMPSDGTSERIESAMQWIGGTASLMGAVGGPDQRAMGTATAVAAAQENASGRMLGPIKQRIYADKQFMFQILENIREFSVPVQWQALERRFGKEAVANFRRANFKRQLRITVAQNTDIPRSMALTQANIMAFGQMAGQLAQVPWGPELLQQAAAALNIPFTMGAGRNDRKEAEKRLAKLSKIAAFIKEEDPVLWADQQRAADEIWIQLAKFFDPLVEIVDTDEEPDETPHNPAAIFMQDHAAFMDVYKDKLFSAGAETMSNAEKLVIIQLYMEHFKAIAAMEHETAKLQEEIVKTTTPQPDAETIEAAARADREAQERAQASELERERMRLEAGEASKDADLERDVLRAEHQASLQVQQGNGAQAGDN